MKKLIRLIFVGIPVVLLVAFLLVGMNLSRVVTTGVRTFGSKWAHVPMDLEGFKLSPLSGKGRATGFTMGNPEGYNTPHSVQVEHMDVKVRASTLRENPIVIEEIIVNEPVITLEVGLKSTNLSDIKSQLKKASKAQAQKEAEEHAGQEPSSGGEAESGKGTKKYIIERIVIQDPQVGVSAKFLDGKQANIPLPSITLLDLGKEGGGAPASELGKEVLDVFIDKLKEEIKTNPSVDERLKSILLIADELEDEIKGLKDKLKDIFGR